VNPWQRSLFTIATMLLVAYADVRLESESAAPHPAVATAGVRCEDNPHELWRLLLAGNPGVSEWGSGWFPGMSAGTGHVRETATTSHADGAT
jgi:hypothetical protein